MMKLSFLALLATAISLVAANPIGCKPNYPPPPPLPPATPVVYPTPTPTEAPTEPATTITTPAPTETPTEPPTTTTSSKLTSSGAIQFLATAYAVVPKPNGANTDGTQGERLGAVNACGQALWISDSGPCTYCPEIVNPNCPTANVTAFDVSGGASLDVEVPGGQQMYLAPDKHVGFTQAHSAFIPSGSEMGPFLSLAVEGEVDGFFVFDSVEWIGCPPNVTQFPGSNGLRLFAQTKDITDADVGGKLSDCRPVVLRTQAFPDGFGAWQYT